MCSISSFYVVLMCLHTNQILLLSKAFTPQHNLFYFIGIARNFIVIAGLHALQFLPPFQTGVVSFVELVAAVTVIRHVPYSNLSQSRTEIMSTLQRAGVFIIAFLPHLPASVSPAPEEVPSFQKFQTAVGLIQPNVP